MVTVSITGTFYKKGTLTVDSIGSGNGFGTGGTSAGISNGGGTWIDIVSSHTGTYNGSSVSFDIEW